VNKISFLLFFLVSLFIGSTLDAQPGDACQISDQALKIAIDIRGLEQKSEVKCLVHDQEQVKEYLISAIDTKVPAEKLAMEELVYKLLGFLPQDFSYKDGLIELYVSQLGGYYDPEKKHFVMAGWMPAVLQLPIAVHELTHALQDQHFNLETFLDHDNHTTDQLLARSALVEGDATAVMIDHTRNMLGQGPLREEESVDMILFQNVLGASMSQEFANAPPSLQAVLLFPYNSGLRFAHRILQKEGYAGLDKIFKKPPESTKEILHPEYYLRSGSKLEPLESQNLLTYFPEDEKPAEDLLVYEDTLGEFFISATLRQCAGDAASASQISAGWTGDRLGVFSDGEQEKILVWKTRWESEVARDEFIEAYQRCFSEDRKLSGEGAGLRWSRGASTISLSPHGKDLVVLKGSGLKN